MREWAKGFAAGVAFGVLVWLGWTATTARGQDTTVHPTYCMMTATKASALAKKTIMTLDCGEQDGTAFVDRTVRDELTGKLAKFDTD